jgi:hypothetical protein
MRHLKLLFLILLVVGFAAPALAVPVLNTADDGFEDFSDGSVYGYYQNSGDLLFVQSGNNEGAPQYADLQDYMLTEYGVELSVTGDTVFSDYDTNSGTWNTVPPLGPDGTISYYAVKGGNYFAMYRLEPAAATGSWSTYDIWAIGGPGTGGQSPRGYGGLELSHFTGYNAGTPPTSVPEPATIFLLGLGLVGMAGLKRKIKKV